MKTFGILLSTIIVAATAACARGVIREVDEGHNNMHAASAPRSTEYSIPATSQLTLSFATYRFALPLKQLPGVSAPNSAEFLINRAVYAVRIPPGATKVVITPGSARPLKQSPPFTGFNRGDDFFVAIGHEEPQKPGDSELHFWPFWVGGFKVSQ